MKSRPSLREEGEGDVMTKAILDVDDCAEGMRKFTTEIFDTGVALASYAGMLLFYDWRLALLCMIFPTISYVTAEKMKKIHEKLLMDIEVLKSTMNRITVYEGKGFSKVEEVQENVDKMVCRAEAIEEINNLSNSKSDLDKEFDELLRQDSNN